MKDRAMQAIHLLGLEPVAESTSDPGSYGFRPLRSTQDAMEHCYNALSCKNRAEWILEADIKACFDQISHQWLVDHVVMDRKILKQWLKAGYLEKQKLYCTEEGTPQGGIASPTLANIALNGLEGAIDKAAKRNQKVNVVRYADDFVVTGISIEVLKNIKVAIESFLAERGLKLSEEKTKITSIYDGFDFLGFNFRKYKCQRQYKLLTKPAKANLKKIRETIRDVARRSISSTTEELIKRLNPKLRGWGNYYRHVVASKAYDAVDHEVFKAVWAWAKRRHPNKSAKWLRKKYFRQANRRNWMFYAKVKDKEGKSKLLDVVYVKKIPIRRYVKIRAIATPYDPAFKEYLEQRQRWKKPSSSGYWSHNVMPKLYNG